MKRREALELTATAANFAAATGSGAGDHPMYSTTAKEQLRDGVRPNVEAGLDRLTRARIVAHAYGLAPPDASPLPASLGATVTTMRLASPPKSVPSGGAARTR